MAFQIQPRFLHDAARDEQRRCDCDDNENVFAHLVSAGLTTPEVRPEMAHQGSTPLMAKVI